MAKRKKFKIRAGEVIKLHPEGEFTPRKWQSDCRSIIRSLAQDGSDRALIYACPGAGKTQGSLFCYSDLRLRVFLGAKLVVVTSNLAIKAQWVKSAKLFGIELLPVKSGDDLRQEGLDLQHIGFVISYQQAINIKHSLRIFCETHDVIVILDEIHHTEGPREMRDGNRWGHSVEYAFAPAKFKISTTGTPFREGNNPISFVRYDDDGKVIAQFTYTYQQAIVDKICRPIEFVLFEGDIQWPDHPNSMISANFAKKLPKKSARKRLRAALSTDGEFPRTILAAAHKKLLEIRDGAGVDRRAAGLVLAMDTAHAEAIADELTAISGQRPVIVHSKIDEAQKLIDAFRDGDQPWIVAIYMLSEGVDIPRLRVGVYASNIRAPLYFHQFCGRLMRVMESSRERAFVFMPADSELEAIALEIEKERCHALNEGEPRPRLTRVGVRGGGQRDLEGTSSSAEETAIAVSGNKYSIQFIRQHQETIRDFRLKRAQYSHLSDAECIQILIDADKIQAPDEEEVA